MYLYLWALWINIELSILAISISVLGWASKIFFAICYLAPSCSVSRFATISGGWQYAGKLKTTANKIKGCLVASHSLPYFILGKFDQVGKCLVDN